MHDAVNLGKVLIIVGNWFLWFFVRLKYQVVISMQLAYYFENKEKLDPIHTVPVYVSMIWFDLSVYGKI